MAARRGTTKRKEQLEVTPTLDVLGLPIPRVGVAFYTALAVHVVAGLVAVITGALAALSRKGGKVHVRSGTVYWVAICAVVGTAAALAAVRWREDYHLVVIGGVSLAGACVGRFFRERHTGGHVPHILGMSVSFIAMLTAFYVDNGPHLPLWKRLPRIVYWVLPAAIGAPITLRAIRRARLAERM
jgi:hypothetical protein